MFDSPIAHMPIADLEERRKYHREWRAKRRAEFFKGKCCIKCGGTDDLELDHIDPAEKTSHKIWTWSESRRLAEIAKCQILCRACHLVKTQSQKPITHGYMVDRHGTNGMYRRGCKCGLCLLWNRNYRRGYRARVGSAA